MSSAKTFLKKIYTITNNLKNNRRNDARSKLVAGNPFRNLVGGRLNSAATLVAPVSIVFSILLAIALASTLAQLSACALLEQSESNSTVPGWMEASLPRQSSMKPLAAHQAEITQLFLLPREDAEAQSRVVAVDKAGQVGLHLFPAGQAYKLLSVQPEPDLLAMRPEKLLLAASYKSVVRLFSLATNTELASLSQIRAKITSLAFNPSGKSLLLGAADGRVYQWNYYLLLGSAGKEITEKTRERIVESYIGHSSVVSAVAYHPFGRIFFSGDWQGGLSAWQNYSADVFAGEYDQNLFGDRFFAEKSVRMASSRGDRKGLDHLFVSPDGQALISGAQDGTLELWKVRGLKSVASVQAYKGVILDLAMSPDGARLASVGREGKVRIWSYAFDDNSQVPAVPAFIKLEQELNAPRAHALAFVDSHQLVIGNADGTVQELAL